MSLTEINYYRYETGRAANSDCRSLEVEEETMNISSVTLKYCRKQKMNPRGGLSSKSFALRPWTQESYSNFGGK